MDYSKYRAIVVTAPNYQKLKELGQAGDSFNNVITRLIEKEQEGPAARDKQDVININSPSVKHYD